MKPQTQQPPLQPPAAPAPASAPTPSSQPPPAKNKDFLIHLETYLAKRDGVDKLLKISRYASKIIIASSLLPLSLPLNKNLKSFESSVGLSRKAFRLGKFIQDVNSLRFTTDDYVSNPRRFLLSVLSYGGEGVYYFLEQIVWISKSGLIDVKHSRNLQKWTACAEFVGYIGSICLKIEDLMNLNVQLSCLKSSVEISVVRGDDCEEERVKMRVLMNKCLMKRLSVIQDLADALMALADIRDSKDVFSSPLLLSCAGLLSALISTHKNWISC